MENQAVTIKPANDARNKADIFSTVPQVIEIIDALPYISALLNMDRQMVYSNKAFKNFMNVENIEDLLGLKPGEAIGCNHVNDSPSGCGTSKHCRFCGIANAIFLCHKNKRTEITEYHLMTNSGQKASYDFQINASPFSFHDQNYTLVTLIDISAEKRWHLLERIFFHDIMNKMGSLHGLIQLQNEDPSLVTKHDLSSLMLSIGEEIIEELQAQHKIILAENRELNLNIQPVNIYQLIGLCVTQIQKHSIALKKEIVFQKEDTTAMVNTDPILLKRVIINLLKNALEAIGESQKVTIGFKSSGYFIEIWVHNPGVIPEDIQLQLFQRSFSTKGADRGLGTYSIKLLTEDYLKGNVIFESNPKAGTIFKVFINQKYPETKKMG